MSLSPYLEDLDSQIPAVQMLCALGWTYLSREDALALRGGRQDRVVLTGILKQWLAANNRIEAKGKTLEFGDVHLGEAIRRLIDEPTAGLVATNKKLYELLTLGTSVDVAVDDDRKGRPVRYVDWLNWNNNVFHVSDEFSVERTRSHDTCRPDLVLFVNGIPFVVIECKRRDTDSHAGEKAVERAIGQLIGYQKDDHIPYLFQFAQLLIASSVNDCKYGTIGTGRKFWSVWKHEGQHEQTIHAKSNEDLPRAVEAALFAPMSEKERPERAKARLWWLEKRLAGDRVPTEQDRTLWGMLRPQMLVPFVRDAMVFDGPTRKVARYPQWFAVESTMRRISAEHGGRREGGVIWHTTGSGKSLTMVMLAKAIALDPGIRNPRVILVTDREELDSQLSTTFRACGKSIERARTGEHLTRLLRENVASVITTIINKFNTVLDKGRVEDVSSNIFVMVDEGHRSNYGPLAAKMRKVFPNACFIAFTGTPLAKKDKNTAHKFGGFIHSYTMRQAVADGAVVPLVYEGRIAELELNRAALDAWFDRITANLKEKQKADLKRKFAKREELTHAQERIKLIAFDISQHYHDNFQGLGLKAQLATDSRLDAVRYLKYFEEFGMVEARLIMSAPDQRGQDDDITADAPPVTQFWGQMMTEYGGEEAYNREIKASFGREDGVELLIVVSKLLTGFDEPRNTVLYIDKGFKDGHNILQAIARVNRVFDGKDHGLVVDYRGILGEMHGALKTYDKLAEFDPKDVELGGALTDVAEAIGQLPQHHGDLWAVFKEVQNQKDAEAMERHLAPEDLRETFYSALRVYSQTLATALASEKFYSLVPRERIEVYKADLKYFVAMRASVQSRYADKIDYAQYEKQTRKLMDTHIHATEVTIVTPEFSIFDVDQMDRALEKRPSAASKADAIASRVAKVCREKMDEDPVFYAKFAMLVQDAIDDYRQSRISELEYLERVKGSAEAVRQGHGQDTPARLDGEENRAARAFYGIFTQSLQASNAETTETSADLGLGLQATVAPLRIVDWTMSPDSVKRIEDAIDDFLFDAKAAHSLDWTTATIDDLLQKLLQTLKKQSGG